ncbi:MAG: SBBP repeat-containing protein [Candidatus Stahlbacteria bacterium]|nr:SBBP repeat-containing protein [Candidatus Stahlbacteria bacterium]
MKKDLGKWLIAIVMCYSVTSSAQAQGWVARYNGSSNQDDAATSMAVDLSGNVYVTGQIKETGSSPNCGTIKYNSNGDTMWIRRYNGEANQSDVGNAIAVDLSGNVYVTGERGMNDYVTIKYNSDGDSLWAAIYGIGAVSNYDNAYAIAVDLSGNVYVTGQSQGTGWDYATIKYNSAGDTMWVRRYNGPGNDEDKARKIVVDFSGNVYVTGWSVGAGTYSDYATIKYNSDGDTLWIRRYNGPDPDGNDAAQAIAVDGSGNVYVTGYSDGMASNDPSDYATIKYNSAGDTVWVRRYDGPGSGIGNTYDWGYAIAVDLSGNVYVTGKSCGSGTASDYATIKYNSDGDTLWIRRYNGPGNDQDEAFAIAVDLSGNVYVTGKSMGSGTSWDYATIKYNAAGDSLWAARYNGPLGNQWDEARAIAVDGEYVYVTGISWDGDSGTTNRGSDYLTIKYSTAGVEERTNPNSQIQNAKLEICPNLSYSNAIINYAVLSSQD